MYMAEFNDSTNLPDKSLTFKKESSNYDHIKYESSKYEPDALTKRK